VEGIYIVGVGMTPFGKLLDRSVKDLTREAVTAAIFWLKTRAGWRETSLYEVSGRDGGPIEVSEQSPRQVARAILHILASARDDQEEARPSLTSSRFVRDRH